MEKRLLLMLTLVLSAISLQAQPLKQDAEIRKGQIGRAHV